MASQKKGKSGGPFDALQALKKELAAREERSREATPGSRPSAGGPSTGPRKPPQTKAPEPPKHGGASEGPGEEEHLFHRMFSGVEPLDRTRGRVPKERGERSDALKPAVKRGSDVQRAQDEEVRSRLSELVEAGARFEVADDGKRVEGRRVDLPFDAVRRLRRGVLPIDARIDLHGMRVDQARVELESFLRATRARGERCVLVIHGKGEHSPQGVGALRGEMAAWLSQGPASHHVAAFVSAAERDGGDGAVYVLLRR